MPTQEDNAATVKRYLELAAKGDADAVAELYADDATVEDPVGSEVHIGRPAIRRFYDALPTNAKADVITLRALGHEVAFHWTLTIDLGENTMAIDIISVMTFNGEGKIASMKAYWGTDNVTQN